MKFTKTLDCGVLGEIECDVHYTSYYTSIQREDDADSVTIIRVEMCINGIKHDITDELSEALIMELKDEALGQRRENAICAAEARADALREERLLERET